MNRQQYLDFMFNVDNVMNCENCPENRQCSSWGGNLPCGQQNCWISVHCDNDENDFDE